MTNPPPLTILAKIRNKIYKGLRFSEKYIHVDLVYLIKGGTWLSIGNIFAAGTGFLLSLSFANLLPKEIYGQYKYILSVASLFSISTLQGMDSAITQAVAKGMDQTLIAGVKTKIKWGMFGSLLSVFFALYYFVNRNVDFVLTFLIVAAFLPFMDSFSLYNSYLSGKKDFKKITLINIVSQFISVFAMIATVFLTRHLYLIVAAYFVPNTFIRLFFFKRIIKNIDNATIVDNKSISYGKHLSLLSILGTITKTIDQVIIYNFVNATALATYSVAVAPVRELLNIIRNLDSLSLPKLSIRKFSDIQRTLLAKIVKLFLLVSLVVVFYIILIPFFYQIFFPGYLDSIRYSQFFSLTLIFYPFILINTAFTAHMMQKELYISSISSSVFYLVFLVVLTYQFGIAGVIATYILNNLFTAVLNIYLFRKAKAAVA